MRNIKLLRKKKCAPLLPPPTPPPRFHLFANAQLRHLFHFNFLFAYSPAEAVEKKMGLHPK